MDFFLVLSYIVVLIFSVIIHEVSHGIVAEKLGDPTARQAGRLTLNPIPHIDPVMSVLLPAMLIMSGSPILFGAAKPVPVNYYNLGKPKRDMMLVAIAGPLSNVLLAFAAMIILVISILVPALGSGGLTMILTMMIKLNLVLAVFNMIPIPPVDGSRVVSYLLPDSLADSYNRLEPFGFYIIIGIFLIPGFRALLSQFITTGTSVLETGMLAIIRAFASLFGAQL